MPASHHIRNCMTHATIYSTPWDVWICIISIHTPSTAQLCSSLLTDGKTDLLTNIPPGSGIGWPTFQESLRVPPEAASITTPLIIAQRQKSLVKYPNRALYSSLLYLWHIPRLSTWLQQPYVLIKISTQDSHFCNQTSWGSRGVLCSWNNSHNNFTTIQETCQKLGIPLALKKLEDPSHFLTFLGIEIHTICMEAWLPQDKLSRISKQLTT